MKLEIVTGVTIFESCRNVIRKIDKDDLTTDFIVIVPDRFTLQAEDLVFKTLGIQSTFNVNVMGMSGFASKLLQAEGVEVNSISQLESLIVVKQIIDKNMDKLNYYKRNSVYLCDEMTKLIRQLKSSLISPEELVYTGERKALQKKTQDIALVYKEYQKEIAGRVDSTDLLLKFSEVAEKSSYLDNSVVIFAGFDSFSSANYSVIKTCVEKAKSVFVGCQKSLNIGNEYIYEKDIIEKLSRLANDIGITIDVCSPITDLNKEQKAIAENLFNVKTSLEGSDYFYSFAKGNIKEEVENIANIIKYATYRGARYRDFSIACNLSKYSDTIERIFTERGISFYLDSSLGCQQSILVKLIKKILLIKNRNFLKEDLLYLLSSDLLTIENRKELIAFCNEKDIHGEKTYKYLNISPFKEYIKNLEKCKSSHDFCCFVREIIDNCSDNYQNYLTMLENEKFLKEKNIEEQVVDVINTSLEVIEKLCGEISVKEFVDLLDVAIGGVEISALPSFCDCVFVGDATNSYFCENNNLVVLGTTSGELPVSSSDCGLLTDKDISCITTKSKIEPTIKMVNRRNRFKVFNLLTLAKENLIISYRVQDDDGNGVEKASFVKDLDKIFPQNDLKSAGERDNDEMLLLTTGGSKNSALLELYKRINERQFNDATASLQKVLDVDLKKMELNRSKLNIDCSKLYFPKNRFSVTQLENEFFACPFRHFVSKGLKLQEKPSVDLKINELGSFYHKLFENFVDRNKNRMKEIADEEIDVFLKEQLPMLFDNERIEFLENAELEIKHIYRTAKQLLSRVVYESKNSSFKPYLLETVIEDHSSFRIKDQNIRMIGKVDRIDRCGDLYRIIDYKTGKITSDLLSDEYYGKKLQLFLYSKALRNKNLDISGVYYFNAKSENKKDFVLKGVTLDKEDVIRHIDSRLYDSEIKTSDIISVKREKDGKFTYKSLSKEEFDQTEAYAYEITQSALDAIADGKISPLPYEKACRFCKYRGICLYDAKRGVRKLTALSEEGEK